MGEDRVIHLARCPLCGGSLRSRWQAVQMSVCRVCGLVVRNPQPEADDLEKLYTESWATPEEHAGDTGGTVADLAAAYVRELRESAGLSTFRGLRVLDYGAGRGAMAHALREAGADVWAVEPFGVEYLIARGLRGVPSLHDIPREVTFDGLVSIDVVEHLHVPWSDLDECRSRLKAGAWAYVATPNAAGLRGKLLGGRWEEASRPGHLMLFTPKSCREALLRSGFIRPTRLRWHIDYGRGGLRAMVHHVMQAAGIDGELRFLAYAS